MITVSDRTLAELDHQRARLVLETERLRTRQRAVVNATPGAAALARQIRESADRVRDYERIIEAVTRG